MKKIIIFGIVMLILSQIALAQSISTGTDFTSKNMILLTPTAQTNLQTYAQPRLNKFIKVNTMSVNGYKTFGNIVLIYINVNGQPMIWKTTAYNYNAIK